MSLPNLYSSTQPGAPLSSGIGNVAGELITILDAVLIDGYGSVTLSTLVVSGGVATATVSVGHGFVNVGSKGPVVQVDGSTPSGLNGKHRITVTSSTTFTFAATGVADGTATGTITAKMAPAGWTKVFSGTNKAVYKSAALTAAYLRVDDSGTTLARARGYVSMTDVDTGSEPFPTDAQLSGGIYVGKTNSSTRRPWIVVADDSSFFFWSAYAGTTYYGELSFFEIDPGLASDGYKTVISGNSSGVNSSLPTMGGDIYIARPISQIGASIKLTKKLLHGSSQNNMCSGQETVPIAATRFGRIVVPAEVWDATTVFRGFIPGIYSVWRAEDQGLVLEDLYGALQGRTLYHIAGNGCGVLFDITGPWYE